MSNMCLGLCVVKLIVVLSNGLYLIILFVCELVFVLMIICGVVLLMCVVRLLDVKLLNIIEWIVLMCV